MADEDATQEEVDGVLETLEAAIDGLKEEEELKVKVESVSAIDKTIKLNVAVFEAEEDATAKVAIFALDEEGEKKGLAIITTSNLEIEDNAVVFDVSSKDFGDDEYLVEVTIAGETLNVNVELEFKAVEKLVADVKAANKAKLAGLLADETYFTGFVAANVDAYAGKVVAALKTVAEIQELVIDKANEEAEAGSHYDDFVEAVDEVDTEYEKYLVLKDFYKHVDDENADKYMADAGGIFTTLNVTATDDEAVQDAIDQINLDEVVTANVTINDDAKPSELNDYKAALEALKMENKTLVNAGKTKAELIEAIEDKLEDIAEAREAADEKIEEAEEALEAFAVAFGDDYDKETEYEDVVKEIAKLQKDDLSVNELKTDTVGTGLEALTAALKTETKKYTIKEDALAALDAFEEAYSGPGDLADIVANDSDITGFEEGATEYRTVKDELYDKEADGKTFKDDILASPNVTSLENAINDLKPITAKWELYNAIMAEEEVAEMEELLYDLEITDYVNLPGVGKTEFAEYVINALEEEGPLADHAALKAKVDNYLTAYKKLISDVKDNIGTVITALENIEDAGFIKGFKTKTPAEKSAIAENVLENMPTGGYKTLAAIIAQM